MEDVKWSDLSSVGKLGIFFLVFIILFMAIGAISIFFIDPLPQDREAQISNTKPVIIQPSQDVVRFGPKPIFNAWDGSYREIETYLKPLLHDPSSLEFESCSEPYIRADCGWQIRCSYRAKNAFGAMVLTRSFFCISNGQVVEIREG